MVVTRMWRLSSFADESSTPDGADADSSSVPSPPELRNGNDVNDQISDLTSDDASTAVDDESSQEHCDPSDAKLDMSSKRPSASKRKNVTKRLVMVVEIMFFLRTFTKLLTHFLLSNCVERLQSLWRPMFCNRLFFIQENFRTHQSGCFWPRPVSYTWKYPSNRRPLPPIIASRCAQQETTNYSPKLQDWFGIVDWLPW